MEISSMNKKKRGFTERVDGTETEHQSQRIHYIPHHPVKKDSTTTPNCVRL